MVLYFLIFRSSHGKSQCILRHQQMIYFHQYENYHYCCLTYSTWIDVLSVLFVDQIQYFDQPVVLGYLKHLPFESLELARSIKANSVENDEVLKFHINS